jgi:hypothetical protein
MIRGEERTLSTEEQRRLAAWAVKTALMLDLASAAPIVPTGYLLRVVFQVVGHFTQGGATINDGRLVAAALAPIWPPRSDTIEWPPRRLAFDDAALDELADSING